MTSKQKKFSGMFAFIAILAIALSACAGFGKLKPEAASAIDEGIQKIQWLKPVTDGIFKSLCTETGEGVAGISLGYEACAAYPLIASGASGVLTLTDAAVKAAVADPTALNQQQVENQSADVAKTAAILATLVSHPEQAAQLVKATPMAKAN